MLLAPVLAWFYGEPRLLLLTIVLSLGMVFSGMSAQHTAILRRKMRYRAIATIYFTAVILSSTVGIIMAKFGAGIWSLVAMALIGSVYGVIASWSVCRWIPSLPRRGAGTRELMAFGGNLTTCNFLNYLTRNMDNILIGKFVGPLALGFYNKAYEILMLPVRQINRPVTNVAVTTLSRLQDNPEQYRSYYRKGQLLTMVIGLPVVVFFFVKADPLVTVVLGQDWAGAIPLFRLLAPAALMGVFNGATGWVYISTGQMRRQLRMEIVVSTIQVTGFAIGLRWGAMGVAASFSIVSVLTFVPSLWYCYRTSVLNLSDFFDTLWRPLAASFIAGSGIYFVNEFFPNIYSNFAVTNLIIDLGFLALLYLLVWQILPGGRKIMGDLSGIFMSAVSRPRVSKAPAS
jgi:PST family polysaccharide transporter